MASSSRCPRRRMSCATTRSSSGARHFRCSSRQRSIADVVRGLLWACLFIPLAAHALSTSAREFMAFTQKLEAMQCEKRKLRREIALAEAEHRDADERTLKKQFSELNRNPETAPLEKRLARLEPRLKKSSDPEDLPAISRQRVEAFYRCE